MEGTCKINTMTNIVYVLVDIMETNLMDMEEEYRKEGYELKHEAKRNFKTAIASIKKLKKDVGHCEESTQENFGNDADMVNALLLTLIDRCGDDDEFTFKMYNYIKSFPSRLKLGLEMDSAFGHLFK